MVFNTYLIFKQVLRPRNMILCSVLTCVASAIVLVAVGGETKYGLYVGTGMYHIYINIYFVHPLISVCHPGIFYYKWSK